MNNWMKIGIAGIALTGTLSALAEEAPKAPVQPDAVISIEEGGFKIEASDLIAKKLRDFRSEEKSESIA